MKRQATVILAAALLSGCGDSTGVSVNDLAGTWTATQYVFTSQVDASQTVDLITQGGSFTLTILEDSTFTSQFLEPGEELKTRTGTVTVVGSTITIAESGQGSPEAFTVSRDGNAMTLIMLNEDYDFDGDDVDEDATLRIELERR